MIPVTAAQTDQPRVLTDDRIRELWRSVSGPYAELTGPLIRFANLCRAEQAATDSIALQAFVARIETLEREAATCRGTNPVAGNPQEWGHVAMIQGLVEQRDAAEQARDALRQALLGVRSTSRQIRDVGCWCDNSRDLKAYGHAVKCVAARTALEADHG